MLPRNVFKAISQKKRTSLFWWSSGGTKCKKGGCCYAFSAKQEKYCRKMCGTSLPAGFFFMQRKKQNPRQVCLVAHLFLYVMYLLGEWEVGPWGTWGGLRRIGGGASKDLQGWRRDTNPHSSPQQRRYTCLKKIRFTRRTSGEIWQNITAQIGIFDDIRIGLDRMSEPIPPPAKIPDSAQKEERKKSQTYTRKEKLCCFRRWVIF